MTASGRHACPSAVAGATFIKLAQWASTRPDFFPPELCTILSELQTSTPAHSPAVTQAQLREAFGNVAPRRACAGRLALSRAHATRPK